MNEPLRLLASILHEGDVRERTNEVDGDTIYNRLREHEAGEHTTSWNGCPTCEGWEAEAKAMIGES